jgi:2-polyprenyl-6-methoxyphenol hydroxylase-like FAD-dependent oxidoreductase
VPGEKPLRRAVIVGASFAGCAAARMLSEYVDEVVILERDVLPAEPSTRRGVPQSRHLHGLLVGGRMAIDRLFPGVTEKAVEQGAVLDDTGEGLVRQFAIGEVPRRRNDLVQLAVSRQLLEFLVREATLSIPNVRIVEGVTVGGLLASDGRIAGVSIAKDLSADGGVGSELEADLVVDASGRVSKTPDWLEALGYQRPPETRVDAFFGYATRTYQAPEDYPKDWTLGMLVFPPGTADGAPRGAALLAQEHGRWIMTLIGAQRDYPPRDEDEFMEFARGLILPELSEAAAAAEPLTDITITRLPPNRWLHYEKVKEHPEGLLLLGDSVCAFNPTHGQGMSSAIMSGELLGEVLERHFKRGGSGVVGVAAAYQSRLAKFVAAPWALSTGVDYKLPEVEGTPQPRAARLTAGYFDRLMKLGLEDEEVQRTLDSVIHLVRPASVLFHPRIALRVLSRWRRLGKPGPGPSTAGELAVEHTA